MVVKFIYMISNSRLDQEFILPQILMFDHLVKEDSRAEEFSDPHHIFPLMECEADFYINNFPNKNIKKKTVGFYMP